MLIKGIRPITPEEASLSPAKQMPTVSSPGITSLSLVWREQKDVCRDLAGVPYKGTLAAEPSESLEVLLSSTAHFVSHGIPTS